MPSTLNLGHELACAVPAGLEVARLLPGLVLELVRRRVQAAEAQSRVGQLLDVGRLPPQPLRHTLAPLARARVLSGRRAGALEWRPTAAAALRITCRQGLDPHEISAKRPQPSPGSASKEWHPSEALAYKHAPLVLYALPLSLGLLRFLGAGWLAPGVCGASRVGAPGCL
jgi:hypothetical protein